MTRSGLPAFDNSIVKPDPTLFSIDLSGTQDDAYNPNPAIAADVGDSR
jgi:hypothetical protein